MQNDMRDRLVDLIKECHKKENDIMFGENKSLEFDEWTGIYADHLIANGVIVLPCKKGNEMREILFRGKTLTGKWVEGAYYKQEEFYGDKEDAHIIITSKETLENDLALESHIVIPETVGQYTGLNDKNGTKIFEGDIIKAMMDYGPAGFYERIVPIEWLNDVGYQWQYFDVSTIEVVGNIHDNPELLGGEDDG